MKSGLTAIVAIPPEEAWESIQAIRRVHDRQVRRWMPHVNLVFPFVASHEIAGAVPQIAAAVLDQPPFEVTLADFRFFRHASGSATVWLAAEPRHLLVALHTALVRAVPECNDLDRFGEGFTPHLSVGQARTTQEAQVLIGRLQAAWQPMRFTIRSVAAIGRTAETPFEVLHEFPLAAPKE